MNKQLTKTYNVYLGMYNVEKKILSTAWAIWGGNYFKLLPEHIQLMYRLVYQEFAKRHPRCKWAQDLKVPTELKNCSKIRYIMLHDTKYIKELVNCIDCIYDRLRGGQEE